MGSGHDITQRSAFVSYWLGSEFAVGTSRYPGFLRLRLRLRGGLESSNAILHDPYGCTRIPLEQLIGLYQLIYRVQLQQPSNLCERVHMTSHMRKLDVYVPDGTQRSSDRSPVQIVYNHAPRYAGSVTPRDQ